MQQLSLFKQKKESDIFGANDNILISCSGGESSMFLTLEFIKRNKHSNILIVFANTGDENEETLKFIKNVEEYYNINIFWIEAYVPNKKGIAPTPVIVNYNIASRDGKPLLDQSEKYGHCAITSPHCTRDLKAGIIKKFAKAYFSGKPYYNLQGIRFDEQTRINWKTAKEKLWDYPLARWGITKPYINSYWKKHKKEHGFRLELKEHQGNCNLCFKKSERKLVKLIREKPCLIIFRITLELVSKVDTHDQYRNNLTAMDLLELAKSKQKLESMSSFGGSCVCAL
jgi:hypothetical protein